MREIPLTYGKVAIVDDADFERVSQFRWRAWQSSAGRWYAQRKWRIGRGRHRYQKLHRFILSAPDGTDVDHRNLDGLDCRRENLRLATRTQNLANTTSRPGSSQYKGVCWHKKHGKWRAYIQLNGKWKHLGYFNSEVDAALAYNDAASELFGEFARVNEIPCLASNGANQNG